MHYEERKAQGSMNIFTVHALINNIHDTHLKIEDFNKPFLLPTNTQIQTLKTHEIPDISMILTGNEYSLHCCFKYQTAHKALTG